MPKYFLSMMILLLVGACAFAQVTSRYKAIGNANIAVADDTGAIINPANLARLDIPEAMEPGDTNNSIGSATLELAGDSDYMGFHWVQSMNPEGSSGIGAGWGEIDPDGAVSADIWTIGYGAAMSDNSSWGVSARDLSLDVWGIKGSETIFNAGFLFNRSDTVPLRVGVLVEDITDETEVGPFFDIGFSTRLAEGTLVAVDVLDVTDEIENRVNFGVEHSISENQVVRGGLYDDGNDHLLTLGFGHDGGTWQGDIAWSEMDDPLDDQIMATFSRPF